MGTESYERNRRKHDLECTARLDRFKDEIKAWVADKICIATKGNKVWNRVMRPVIMLILAVLVGGNVWGIAISSDQKATDATQDEQIEHIKEDHGALTATVEKMRAKQSKMDVRQEGMDGKLNEILHILEKELQ